MYTHSIFARRAFPFLLLIAGICLAQPALAIEKYAAVPLPDEGLGSNARALTKVGVGTLGVVGSQQKSDGTVGAMFWGIAVDPSDPSGNTYFIELPKPPGWNAEATGLAFIEQGNLYNLAISGNIVSPSGVSRAAIWTRDTAGQFAGTIFDDEAAASAITTRNTPLGLIIVVCGKFRLANGNWHACVWMITNQGTQRIDLGTLSQNSEATAVANRVDDLIGWNFVGRSQRPDGRWIATCWIAMLTGSSGLDWFLTALPTPPGSQSRANYVGSSNAGVWKISGDITDPNGRRSASVWINQGEIPTSFVSQLYQDVLSRTGNTTANGIVDFVDEDEIMVVGAAQTSLGLTRGVAALPFNQHLDAPFLFDALLRGVTVGAAQEITVGALRAVEPGGAIAGEGLMANSATVQAMLFLPIDVEAPQHFSVLVGNESGDIVDLWQVDGNALRILPRREGRVASIVIDFASDGFSAAALRTPRSVTLVSRIIPRNLNTNSPLTLTLQLYDSSAMQWVTVASRILTAGTYGRGAFFRLEMEVPDPGRFAIVGGAPLRGRIGLRGEEWRDFGVDMIEVQVERMP